MLPPHALLDAHLAPFLDAQATTLTTRLEELRKENGELGLRLRAQRAEMEGLVGGLEDLVRDLESAAGLVQGGEWSGLGGEVRAVEKEIGQV
jgi:kinetochore protein NNF1